METVKTKMSINRALAELKLLDSRINDKIKSTTFVTFGKKAEDNITSSKVKKVDFISDAKANLKSVTDLIERRKAIKSLIVLSNATTKVVIGEKEMTVAEAIERKSSIVYEKELLIKLRQQLSSAEAQVSRNNEQVQVNLNQILLATFGKETKGKETDINQTTASYLAINEFETVTIDNIDKLLQLMKDELDTFIAEVDGILTDSNSLTQIEI